MYLLGDIGNTEVKICYFSNSKKLLKKVIFNSKNINQKILKKKFIYFNQNKKKIKKIIFSSVVPAAFKKIKYYINNKTNIKINELKEFKLAKEIKVNANLNQVGSDRLANALSVINGKDNFIILDFGTATTFDIIIKNKYLGGIIAPGVSLSLNTLISNASLIPPTSLAKIKDVIGKNTKNAVRSGFYWGYQGLIEKITQMILKKTKRKFKIIFTGGLAHLFKKAIKNNKVEVDRDLTIKGLLKLIK